MSRLRPGQVCAGLFGPPPEFRRRLFPRISSLRSTAVGRVCRSQASHLGSFTATLAPGSNLTCRNLRQLQAKSIILITIMTNLARFLLGLAGAVGFVDAAPISYSINFTALSGVAPTASSFTYDSDVPAFSNFLVVWKEFTFDLSASANGSRAPLATGACNTLGPPAADVFAYLTDPTCGGAPGGFEWFTLPDIFFRAFFFRHATPAQQDQLAFYEFSSSFGGGIGSEEASGVFSVSQVPEPSTMTMAIGAGAMLAWQRWRRNKLSEIVYPTGNRFALTSRAALTAPDPF